VKVAQTKLKDLQIDSKSLKGLYNSSLQIHAESHNIPAFAWMVAN